MIYRLIQIKKQLGVVYFILCFFSGSAFAATQTTTTLKEVVVSGKIEKQDVLPDVQGTKIYSGKKTSLISLEETPAIVNNNYRQAFEKTPGLLVSEESTPLVSFGYRGLNPDRAQLMQVMKDGVPIVADVIGYPEAYYTPPLQTIQEIEFVRGGSSLLYGPQPGGALNYVTKDPYSDTFRLETENSFGSHDLFSHYTSVSGTPGPLGYYAYLHHRQSQGFREFNSQFDVNDGGAKLVLRQDDISKWTASFDLYEEKHGEPGGLTRAAFDVGSDLTTRPIDHFELNRYSGTLAYEREVSDKTRLEWKLFGGYYERLSWRQRGGGFGTLPVGAAASTTDIQSQEFYTVGTDLRFKHDYEGFAAPENTLSGGLFYYHSDSPRVEQRGTTADALEGTVRKDSDREGNYLALFLENMFKWGQLSITPALRLENIWQSIQENINLDKTAVPLGNDSSYDLVALAGVGAEYEIGHEMEFYANYSESYRPKVYADAIPLGANQVINADLEEGNSWQADLGFRGQPVSYLNWDASIFHMEFDGQTGTVLNTVQNVGDAEYQGIELVVELDTIGLWDAVAGSAIGQETGSLKIFYNSIFLDAEFIGGPSTGKIPQQAPDYLTKTGLEYDYFGKAKIRLAGTFADDAFGDDSNSTQRLIPSYKVWDLTAEIKVYKEMISVFGGINNLFDEQYFSRVTGAGIDPADGRNYYLGVRFVW